jgi:hypothetical protein
MKRRTVSCQRLILTPSNVITILPECCVVIRHLLILTMRFRNLLYAILILTILLLCSYIFQDKKIGTGYDTTIVGIQYNHF